MTFIQEDILSEVDLESSIPCSISVNKICPREAEWIQYLDCGAHGQPSCTEHKIEVEKYFEAHIMRSSLCILGHEHFVWELKWRKL